MDARPFVVEGTAGIDMSPSVASMEQVRLREPQPVMARWPQPSPLQQRKLGAILNVAFAVPPRGRYEVQVVERRGEGERAGEADPRPGVTCTLSKMVVSFRCIREQMSSRPVSRLPGNSVDMLISICALVDFRRTETFPPVATDSSLPAW